MENDNRANIDLQKKTSAHILQSSYSRFHINKSIESSMGESWKHAKFVNTGILEIFIPTGVLQDTEEKIFEKLCKMLFF